MPYKVGVGAVEPKGFVSPYKIAAVAFVAILVMVFTHIFSIMGHQKRIIIEKEYFFNDSLHTLSFVTPKFHLDKRRSNLQFDVAASVDNSWFELNATLVNAITGTEYSLEKGVEYYHGYSDGESWTEGSRKETAYMSKVPAGTYYLQIMGTRENKKSGYGFVRYNDLNSFHLTVTYDTPNDRNLVVCLILLLIFPLAQYGVVQHNEKSRWSNSPFSPFNHSNEY